MSSCLLLKSKGTNFSKSNTILFPFHLYDPFFLLSLSIWNLQKLFYTTKLYDIGVIPVTCSDSKGAIHDPNGIDLALLKQIKLKQRASLERYAEEKLSLIHI